MDIDLVCLILVGGFARAYYRAYGRTTAVLCRAINRRSPQPIRQAALLPDWICIFTPAAAILSLFTAWLGFYRHSWEGLALTLGALLVCTVLARQSLPKQSTAHYVAPCLQKLADRFTELMQAGDFKQAARVRRMLIISGIQIAEITEADTVK
jgi:hypothetical protein